MRIVIGVFLLLHGFAHVVGFAIPWRLVKDEQMPYKTTLLSGHVDVGDLGIRLIGILWLLGALAFAVAGVGVLTGRSWALTWLTAVTVASLLLSVLGWPDARVGAAVNAVVLAALVWGRVSGWF